MPVRRERTVEYGIMGDVSGNARIAGTDLVLFQLVGVGGRPQIGLLPRLETGEITYDAISQTYTAVTGMEPVPGQPCVVERTGGRAPGGWRVVGVVPVITGVV